MKRTFLMGFLGGIVGFIMMAGLIGLANPTSAWFSSQQEPPGNINADPAGLEVTAKFTEGERVGANTSLGTAFTYQGYLKKDGQPYTGQCTMKFTIYNGDPWDGGVPLIYNEITPVQVTNGLFAEDIDFGASYFTGDYRSIVPEFKCPVTSDYVTMPSQPIRAVPYAITALGLRPGVLIEGTALNSYAHTFGVHNESEIPGSAAVYGLSEKGPGVYATTNSATEPALMAYSNDGPALGIWGKIAVYGTSSENTPAFKHTVNSSNRCLGLDYITVIDNNKINNNAKAILLVTYHDQGGDPPRSPVGVSYLTGDGLCGTGTGGHWVIYSLANPTEALLDGQTFNVLAVDLVIP